MRRRDLLRHATAFAPLAAVHGLRGQQTDLRITRVKAYAVRVTGADVPRKPPTFAGPYDPARWSYLGPYSQLTSAIFVVIETNQGITGYGFGAGGAVSVQIIEGHLQHLLNGMNPLEIELLWDQMYSSAFAYGRRGVFVMALSGVDNALWDIFGKFTKQPVWQLLGGKVREKSPLYQTNGDIAKARAMGITRFKFSVRDGFRHEGSPRRIVEQLTRQRKEVGEDALMMIDCGAKWDDVAFTLDMARRLEPIRLYAIEEALHPDNLEGKARLVSEIDSTYIASGEHEYTQHGAADLLGRKACDIIQPDVSWCGGVTALRKIATLAEEHNVQFIPHRGGSLYGLPLVMTTPHCPMAESFGTNQQGTELMQRLTPQFEDGYYFASDEPGFGANLTEELIQQHAV